MCKISKGQTLLSPPQLQEADLSYIQKEPLWYLWNLVVRSLNTQKGENNKNKR